MLTITSKNNNINFNYLYSLQECRLPRSEPLTGNARGFQSARLQLRRCHYPR